MPCAKRKTGTRSPRRGRPQSIEGVDVEGELEAGRESRGAGGSPQNPSDQLGVITFGKRLRTPITTPRISTCFG